MFCFWEFQKGYLRKYNKILEKVPANLFSALSTDYISGVGSIASYSQVIIARLC